MGLHAYYSADGRCEIVEEKMDLNEQTHLEVFEKASTHPRRVDTPSVEEKDC